MNRRSGSQIPSILVRVCSGGLESIEGMQSSWKVELKGGAGGKAGVVSDREVSGEW